MARVTSLVPRLGVSARFYKVSWRCLKKGVIRDKKTLDDSLVEGSDERVRGYIVNETICFYRMWTAPFSRVLRKGVG